MDSTLLFPLLFIHNPFSNLVPTNDLSIQFEHFDLFSSILSAHYLYHIYGVWSQ